MSFAATHLVGFGARRATSATSYGVSLNGSDEQLSRTPGSAGNRRKAAVSIWVRRNTTGTVQTIFAAGTGATNVTRQELRFNASNQLTLASGGGVDFFATNGTLTDTSGWHHILLHWDTDNATASNRALIWLDGSALTSMATDNRSSIVTGTDYAFNSTAAHYIGRGGDTAARFLAADIALVHYIDGDLPAVGSFYSGGSPVTYSGTYGTNGVKLAFETASDLGNDTSGNNLDWTLTNIDSSDQITNGPA